MQQSCDLAAASGHQCAQLCVSKLPEQFVHWFLCRLDAVFRAELISMASPMQRLPSMSLYVVPWVYCHTIPGPTPSEGVSSLRLPNAHSALVLIPMARVEGVLRLHSSKLENSETEYFGIVATQNDQEVPVQHVVTAFLCVSRPVW